MTIESELIWILITGLFGALMAMAVALTKTANALGESSQANKNQSEANSAITTALVAVNNELQENARERTAWLTEKSTLMQTVVDLQAAIRTMQTEQEIFADRHAQQLSALQARLRQAEKVSTAQIRELETVKTSHEQELEKLQERIKALEDERDQLKGEREMLIAKLAAVEEERDGLATRVSELEAKVDKLQARNGDTPASGPGETKQSPEPESQAKEQTTEG